MAVLPVLGGHLNVRRRARARERGRSQRPPPALGALLACTPVNRAPLHAPTPPPGVPAAAAGGALRHGLPQPVGPRAGRVRGQPGVPLHRVSAVRVCACARAYGGRGRALMGRLAPVDCEPPHPRACVRGGMRRPTPRPAPRRAAAQRRRGRRAHGARPRAAQARARGGGGGRRRGRAAARAGRGGGFPRAGAAQECARARVPRVACLARVWLRGGGGPAWARAAGRAAPRGAAG